MDENDKIWSKMEAQMIKSGGIQLSPKNDNQTKDKKPFLCQFNIWVWTTLKKRKRWDDNDDDEHV